MFVLNEPSIFYFERVERGILIELYFFSKQCSTHSFFFIPKEIRKCQEEEKKAHPGSTHWCSLRAQWKSAAGIRVLSSRRETQSEPILSKWMKSRTPG